MAFERMTPANLFLAQIDNHGKPLSRADWIAFLEELFDGIDSRLDAAKEDEARNG